MSAPLRSATAAAAMLAVMALLGPAPTSRAKPVPRPPKQVRIDLDKAVALSLPEMKADLKSASFRTADGRTGWVLRIPGNRPLATPAYADGRLFVGGGYGSHEFYAFDATTGKLAWEMKTSDDGPTAAVVEDGCVAFNTESCTVIVGDAKTGKVLWQEWLGDPLMSQPAIWKGRLYMAYPAGQRGHAPNGQPNAPVPQMGGPIQQSAAQKPAAKPAPGTRSTDTHRMLCANLRTGKHFWDVPIAADVITAPVVEDGKLFFTCFDGTSFSLDAITGKVLWRKKHGGTSAPLVANGSVIVTEKATKGGTAYEGIKRLSLKEGHAKDQTLIAGGKAEYLAQNKGGGVGLSGSAAKSLDAGVGFATAPPSAQLGGANANVGVNSVVGGWAYQGSRAAYGGGQIMNAQGSYLNAISAKGGRMNWRAEARGRRLAPGSQVFVPPALGKRDLYLCSTQGHLLSVRQSDGKVGFLYAVKHPMAFQPALANGSMVAGTINGLLICLKTGDKDADGWSAWGGNAQHNKKR